MPTILVNDDQRGPYREMRFLDGQTWAARMAEQQPEARVSDLDLERLRCPISIDLDMPFSGRTGGGEDLANIWSMIIPLPQGVMLSAEQAERKSARVIRWWHLRRGVSLPEDMVLRTYLAQSSNYKSRARASGMSPFVKMMISGKPMPRWIWVTEVSSVDSYNSASPPDWLINGQVIVDATGNAFTPDFLLFHYIIDNHAVLVTMKPEHGDAEEAFGHHWGSYTHTKRYKAGFGDAGRV